MIIIRSLCGINEPIKFGLIECKISCTNRIQFDINDDKNDLPVRGRKLELQIGNYKDMII